MPGLEREAGNTLSTKIEIPQQPGSRRSLPSAQSSLKPMQGLTPEEAMAQDELRRMRLFVPFVLGLAAVVGIALWILGGDPLARLVMVGGLGLGVVGSLWVRHGLIHHPDQVTRYHFWFGMVCVGVVTCAFYYFGIMSPALIVVTFGAFIFTVGQSFRGALTISLTLIVIHLTMSVLTITGVIEDRGLFRPYGMSIAGQLTTLAMVHFVFIGTFVLARHIRTSTASTLEDLHKTARAVAQREMLLAEARQDLFQALQVGGPGRYTDQTLGHYRLGVLLGRGGMGEIYEAQHQGNGVGCAIKLLHPHLAADPSHFERFQREAQLCMALRAPNVVKVLEVSQVGETPPYIVMERLHGKDLASLLKERTRLPPREVVEMVREVAVGLEAARVAGVVHRDLKPQNIFLAEREDGSRTWKILDFGASTLRSHHGTLTAGQVIGTPQYMPPEQARGQAVDHKADLYSLAVIAYRALTGYPAFPGHDLPAVLFAVTTKMPSRPSELAPLPPQVDDVLLVGMAKEPAHRYEGALDLANHLAAAVDGRIDPDLRARAWLLAADWPWGAGGGARPPSPHGSSRADTGSDKGARKTEPMEKLDRDELTRN